MASCDLTVADWTTRTTFDTEADAAEIFFTDDNRISWSYAYHFRDSYENLSEGAELPAASSHLAHIPGAQNLVSVFDFADMKDIQYACALASRARHLGDRGLKKFLKNLAQINPDQSPYPGPYQIPLTKSVERNPRQWLPLFIALSATDSEKRKANFPTVSLAARYLYQNLIDENAAAFSEIAVTLLEDGQKQLNTFVASGGLAPLDAAPLATLWSLVSKISFDRLCDARAHSVGKLDLETITASFSDTFKSIDCLPAPEPSPFRRGAGADTPMRTYSLLAFAAALVLLTDITSPKSRQLFKDGAVLLVQRAHDAGDRATCLDALRLVAVLAQAEESFCLEVGNASLAQIPSNTFHVHEEPEFVRCFVGGPPLPSPTLLAPFMDRFLPDAVQSFLGSPQVEFGGVSKLLLTLSCLPEGEFVGFDVLDRNIAQLVDKVSNHMLTGQLSAHHVYDFCGYVLAVLFVGFPNQTAAELVRLERVESILKVAIDTMGKAFGFPVASSIVRYCRDRVSPTDMESYFKGAAAGFGALRGQGLGSHNTPAEHASTACLAISELYYNDKDLLLQHFDGIVAVIDGFRCPEREKGANVFVIVVCLLIFPPLWTSFVPYTMKAISVTLTSF